MMGKCVNTTDGFLASLNSYRICYSYMLVMKHVSLPEPPPVFAV